MVHAFAGQFYFDYHVGDHLCEAARGEGGEGVARGGSVHVGIDVIPFVLILAAQRAVIRQLLGRFCD